jgi:short-subunit dehydrogenase
MRARKSGVIVNISSAEFWDPHPVASVYAASKFALEGELSLLP